MFLVLPRHLFSREDKLFVEKYLPKLESEARDVLYLSFFLNLFFVIIIFFFKSLKSNVHMKGSGAFISFNHGLLCKAF